MEQYQQWTSLEGEVEPELREQFELLKKCLQENQRLADEFACNRCHEQLQEVYNEFEKAADLYKSVKRDLDEEKSKGAVISDRVSRDKRMAVQIEQVARNPQRRANLTDYAHVMVDDYERSLDDYYAKVEGAERTVKRMHNDL